METDTLQYSRWQYDPILLACNLYVNNPWPSVIWFKLDGHAIDLNPAPCLGGVHACMHGTTQVQSPTIVFTLIKQYGLWGQECLSPCLSP